MPQSPEDIPRLFAEAWNTRDAAALATLFAVDADFVNVVGLWWHNRADIERAHHYGLSTFFAQSHIAARRVKVRPVGADVAIIHTRWKLTGQIDKAGSGLDDRFSVMTFVARRVPEGWLVQAAQNTDVVTGKETNIALDGRIEAADYRPD